MNLIVYPRLSTRSRRAMLRARGRFGHPYEYFPRGTLLQRLASELGWTIEAVSNQIQKERRYFLKDSGQLGNGGNS